MSSVMRYLPTINRRNALVFGAACIGAAGVTRAITPSLTSVAESVDLESRVPKAFGAWQDVPSAMSQVRLSTNDDPNIDQPYDQTVMRSYVDTQEKTGVMLALAWGQRQRQEVKVHRPDLCYVAQGYRVVQLEPVEFTGIGADGRRVVGKRMLAMSDRLGGEAVSYWIRIGHIFSESAVDTRLHILREGLAGHILDGILVRGSMRVRRPEEAELAYPVIEAFLSKLVNATPPDAKKLLVG